MTLTITNNWPDTAENTVVSGTLPAWVSYVSDDSGGSAVWQDITWDLWTMISWAVVIINLTLNFATGWATTLTFDVSSDTVDPSAWDNTASRNVTVLQADLWITLSWATTLYSSIDSAQTMTLNNNWPNLANNAVAEVTLPVWVNVVSATNGTYNAGTRKITWNAWTISNGGSYTRNYVVNSTTIDSYVLNWEVTSTTPDWTPANNTTTRNIDVQWIPVDPAMFAWAASISYDWNNNAPSVPESAEFTAVFYSRDNVPSTLQWLAWWIQIDVQCPVWFNYTSFWWWNWYTWASYDSGTRIFTVISAVDWDTWPNQQILILNGNITWTWNKDFTATISILNANYVDTNLTNNSITYSVEITAVVPSNPIELRASNIPDESWVASVSALSLDFVDVLPNFTEDIVDLWWWVYRLGYVEDTIWTWTLEITITAEPFRNWPYSTSLSFIWADPTTFDTR